MTEWTVEKLISTAQAWDRAANDDIRVGWHEDRPSARKLTFSARRWA